MAAVVRGRARLGGAEVGLAAVGLAAVRVGGRRLEGRADRVVIGDEDRRGLPPLDQKDREAGRGGEALLHLAPACWDFGGRRFLGSTLWGRGGVVHQLSRHFRRTRNAGGGWFYR